jgi:hypothetical protein
MRNPWLNQSKPKKKASLSAKYTIIAAVLLVLVDLPPCSIYLYVFESADLVAVNHKPEVKFETRKESSL